LLPYTIFVVVVILFKPQLKLLSDQIVLYHGI